LVGADAERPVGRVLRPPRAGDAHRTVALSRLVVDLVAAFGTNDDGLMFHTAGRPVDRATGWRYISTAAKQAGLNGRVWHDLRHHHAPLLLSAGVSPALVAERLGHDIATLPKVYAHVIPQRPRTRSQHRRRDLG
jgi:site-specific recombinase XerD